MWPGLRPIAISAALFLSAVPVVDAADAGIRPADAAGIDDFVLRGPLFLPGTTTVPIAVIRSLGELERESVSRAASRLDPIKVDEFRTFVFDGLEIYGYVGDRQELWPVRITVTKPQWPIRDGLAVGSAASRVAERLGAPTEVTPDVLTYHGDTQNVNFYLDAGRITRVEFIYYQD